MYRGQGDCMGADLALLQNKVGVGGRSKVLAGAVKTLGDSAEDIYLFTFSSRSDFDNFVSHYGLSDFQLSLRRVPIIGTLIPGTIYQQPLLNTFAYNELSEFDLVFNSNNCLRFLPAGPHYVNYIHEPTPAIPKTDQRYVNSRLLRLAAFPIGLLHRYSSASLSNRQSILVNSAYTGQQFESVYGQAPDNIVYPPCIDSVEVSSFRGEGVMSLGSFHPNKRQLFQIQVASRLPDTPFTIVGRKASSRYFKRCAAAIRSNGLDNVELLTDLSISDIKQLLEARKVFLHTMINEPFGISIVEAINHGCVPIVHDSGGQREIVTDDEFRFEGLDDCVELVRNTLQGNNHPRVEPFLDKLTGFTYESFRRNLLKTLPNEEP